MDVVYEVAPDVAAESGFAELAPIRGEDVIFEDMAVTWFKNES